MATSRKPSLRRMISAITLKMPVPGGKILSAGQAEIVIENWKSESRQLSVRSDTMQKLSSDISDRIEKLADDIPEALELFTEAKKEFRKAKDPLEKRKWASKLIVRSKYYNYMRESHKSLISNVERVKDGIEDAQVVYALLQNRVKDAEIYFRLNGHLKLVGKALIDARTKFPMPEVEYSNFEYTMERLEKEISGRADKDLLNEANEVYKLTANKKVPNETKS